MFARHAAREPRLSARGRSPEDVDAAVQLLGMRALVQRLGGYDAELDPATLSAGERQLITLVRAYVSPAWLVILDEASLPPRSRPPRPRRAGLRRAGPGRSRHRPPDQLGASRAADPGARRDAGAHGTHDDLLQRSALYRDLVGHWHSGGVHAA